MTKSGKICWPSGECCFALRSRRRCCCVAFYEAFFDIPPVRSFFTEFSFSFVSSFAKLNDGFLVVNSFLLCFWHGVVCSKRDVRMTKQ